MISLQFPLINTSVLQYYNTVSYAIDLLVDPSPHALTDVTEPCSPGLVPMWY